MRSVRVERWRAQAAIEAAIREGIRQQLPAAQLTSHVRAAARKSSIPTKVWTEEVRSQLRRLGLAS